MPSKTPAAQFTDGLARIKKILKAMTQASSAILASYNPEEAEVERGLLMAQIVDQLSFLSLEQMDVVTAIINEMFVEGLQLPKEPVEPIQQPTKSKRAFYETCPWSYGMCLNIANSNLSEEAKVLSFYFLTINANSEQEARHLSSQEVVAQKTGLPIQMLDSLMTEIIHAGFVTVSGPGVLMWITPEPDLTLELSPSETTLH